MGKCECWKTLKEKGRLCDECIKEIKVIPVTDDDELNTRLNKPLDESEADNARD